MTRAELEERFPSVVITPEHPGSERFEIVDGGNGGAGLRGVLWDEGRGVVSFEAGSRGRDHDDIPAAPPTPGGPIVADLALRADGLGDVEFQGPAGDLVPALTERFGLPAEETSVRARPGVPMRGPLGYFPESELRHVRWYDPGLSIVVADGQHYEHEPGDLRLVYWSTSSSRLRLETGVGVGSTLSELIGAYPAVKVGYSDECAGAYFPASFYADTEAGRLNGTVDWDWVSDVQRALNARGATLVVDGEYGPRTRAAVEAFQIEAAIDSTAWYDGPGEAGPLTLDALGIAPPANSYVAGLRAGSTGSC
jgi:hypothetical protein